MKKNELAQLKEANEITELLEEKFSEWDSIRENGKVEGYNADGYYLNNIRNDIIQLRKKLNRLPNVPMQGQTSMFGEEVPEERQVPELFPMNWMSEKTAAKKTRYIEAQMLAALSV